jgi:LuxR family transcriptional regulator, maltose regulon positive regulatory protein
MAEVQQLGIAAAERYYLDALRLAEQHVGPNSAFSLIGRSTDSHQ